MLVFVPPGNTLVEPLVLFFVLVKLAAFFIHQAIIHFKHQSNIWRRQKSTEVKLIESLKSYAVA